MTSFPTAVKARENFGPRRIRGGKDLRNRTTQSTAVHERAAYAPGPKTPSEHFIADLLRSLGLKFDYECREFTLTLTGKGKSAIKPDFYVRKFAVFIEVTLGNDINMDFKRDKISNAHKLYPWVTIVLVGPDELRRLNNDDTTLPDLIEIAKQEREAHERSANVA